VADERAQLARATAHTIQAARGEYARILATLRAGGQVRPDQILDAIARARLHPHDFIRAFFTTPTGDIRPGDNCPRCRAKGAVRVRTSKRQRATGLQVRYLVCKKCGKPLGKQIVHSSGLAKRRGDFSCTDNRRGRK